MSVIKNVFHPYWMPSLTVGTIPLMLETMGIYFFAYNLWLFLYLSNWIFHTAIISPQASSFLSVDFPGFLLGHLLFHFLHLIFVICFVADKPARFIKLTVIVPVNLQLVA